MVLLRSYRMAIDILEKVLKQVRVGQVEYADRCIGLRGIVGCQVVAGKPNTQRAFISVYVLSFDFLCPLVAAISWAWQFPEMLDALDVAKGGKGGKGNESFKTHRKKEQNTLPAARSEECGVYRHPNEPAKLQKVKQEVAQARPKDGTKDELQADGQVKSEVKEEAQERGNPGKASDTNLELKETQAMKREVKDEEAATREQVKEEIAQKDLKKEVKEEVSKDAHMDVKTEIKKEVSKNMSKEVKEEMPQKAAVKGGHFRDMKQEVKEEVRPEMKPQIGDEAADAHRAFAATMKVRDAGVAFLILCDISSGVKAETKHEVKQEELYSGLGRLCIQGIFHWKSIGLRMQFGWSQHTFGQRRQPIMKTLQSYQLVVSGSKDHDWQCRVRRISQKKSETSVPSFESRMTEWAEKCLAFQSSGKTWLPTKPCCPASPFLGLAGAPWQGCARDKTTACVQLLGKDQFRELRDFYRENPQHALFHDNSDASSGRQTETTVVSRLQAHRSSTGTQHRAAECMKMWPWMRDLPTRAWAGNGWLLVEDGMMKLSPTGGGSAMQGLEIFESIGSVPEPGEPKSSEQTSGAEPRAEQGQVVTARFQGLERQSGIQGISWSREMTTWRVQWNEGHSRKARNFPISKHMKLGLSEAEALEAALEEAKAFREELVRQGKLKPPKPSTEKASGSAVRGIKYDKNNGTYRVQMTDPSTKKLVHGGMFKVKEEAEARARELGVESEGGVVPVKPLSEIPHFEPLGPQPGIKWNRGEQAWHAQCNVSGSNRNMRFRPKDFSVKEVEKAWKQAVVWRKQQEKERERAEQSQKRKR
ncbi:unnamed protein product [Symbiodinium sp. KB8]|nr:unnamed protein product [Symbiodinium sp. KB8]